MKIRCKAINLEGPVIAGGAGQSIQAQGCQTPAEARHHDHCAVLHPHGRGKRPGGYIAVHLGLCVPMLLLECVVATADEWSRAGTQILVSYVPQNLPPVLELQVFRFVAALLLLLVFPNGFVDRRRKQGQAET